MIFERYEKSVEGDVNNIFQNVVLVIHLADPRGPEVFDLLKSRDKDDANVMTSGNNYKEQFQKALKK